MTNEAKPSEVAINLVDAAQNGYGGHAIRCTCGSAPEHWADQHDTALSIDAAIAAAVAEERERCAGIVNKNAICRGSLREALAAIRAGPQESS